MKTAVGVASNVLARPDGEGAYLPLCEVELIIEERELYREDDGGGRKSRYAYSTVRFTASPEYLREIADNLCETASRSEDELLRFIQACRVQPKAEGGEG